MSTKDRAQLQVEATMTSYISMLSAELRDEPYNKSEYRRMLQALLNDCSNDAIEKKHQNVRSISLGIPYIRGYKPVCLVSERRDPACTSFRDHWKKLAVWSHVRLVAG